MTQTQLEPQMTGLVPQSLRATVSRRRLIMILVGIMLGMLLAALDQTVVGTAMPRIITELNGLQHYAWVATAYMLASTVTVPMYGKLSDIYGRRPFFIGAMVLFLIGSALSGASQDMTQLILFRAIQGLGAGGLMPVAQAIIGDIFPPKERGKWQGIMMAVFGLATIVGPVAGGLITDHWGWRWVFYVNIPVGLLAMVVAGIAMPAHSAHREHALDYLGAATLVAGSAPLLLAFSWAGTEYPWGSSRIVGLMIFAAIMLIVFFFIERRAAEPIINPSLFTNSIFSVSVVATFLASAGMFGTIMYVPLFVQMVIGDSATSAGAVLTPMMIGFMASSIIGGQVLSRTGRYKALAIGAFAVAAIGMFLLSRMDINATDALVVRNMVVSGLGIGVMMSIFTIVVHNAFPFRQLGEVTAGLAFFRSIGGTIGIAILGTVMNNNFHTTLRAHLPSALEQVMSPDKLAALENPQVLLSPVALSRLHDSFAALGPQGQALFEQLTVAIRVSLASSITSIFFVGTITMALAMIVSLFLREIPLRRSHSQEVSPGLESKDKSSTLS